MEKENLVYFVSTFVVRYRSAAVKEKTVHPGTLKGYVISLQRVLREELGTSDLNMFKIKQLMTVLDNRIRELQRSGLHGSSHNTLSLEDVRKIFTYLNKGANYPRHYLERLVFTIGLSTGLRPGAMHRLKVNQLKFETIRGVPDIMFYAAVGGIDGESKTHRGGFNTVGARPRIFQIRNEYI